MSPCRASPLLIQLPNTPCSAGVVHKRNNADEFFWFHSAVGGHDDESIRADGDSRLVKIAAAIKGGSVHWTVRFGFWPVFFTLLWFCMARTAAAEIEVEWQLDIKPLTADTKVRL